eukprot:6214150-Pleurochrysis_carterae.AAC.1
MDSKGKRKRNTHDAIGSMIEYSEEAEVAATRTVPFEDNATMWRRRLQEVRDFIEEHGGRRRPSKVSYAADEKRLGKWVSQQQFNYANKVNIMKNSAVIKEWETFVHAHERLFEDGSTAWRRTFHELQEFMEARGMEHRPSRKSDDAEERRFARWIESQQSKYARNTHIMKNVAIRDEWARFMDKRSVMFEYRATVWMRTLHELNNFVVEKHGERRPSRRSKDANERRLAHWMRNQESNYAQNANIMKDISIRDKWTEFVETHPTLFGDGSSALRRILRNFPEVLEELGELCTD